MHKLYHGIMENVNDSIPEDYNIHQTLLAQHLWAENKTIFASL